MPRKNRKPIEDGSTWLKDAADRAEQGAAPRMSPKEVKAKAQRTEETSAKRRRLLGR